MLKQSTISPIYYNYKPLKSLHSFFLQQSTIFLHTNQVKKTLCFSCSFLFSSKVILPCRMFLFVPQISMGKTLPNDPMSSKLKLLSLKVRGLRNVNKRWAIFSYLKSQKATIFCLQEIYSSIEDEKVWAAEWGGNFFSRGSSHSRRVCVLLNPHSAFHLRRVERTQKEGF